MKNLPNEVFEQFARGHFTVKQSDRQFSAIAIDQAHEQNNKIVKIDGGAIGLMDDEQSLIEWAVSGPSISQMVKDVNSDIMMDLCELNSPHHVFEASFRNHRNLLLKSFCQFGNPFKETREDLINIVSKVVFPKVASYSVMKAYDLGQEQVDLFFKKRISNLELVKKESLYDTIHRNRFMLYRK